MPKVWCAGIQAGSKGATAGTYDALGTITVKKGSTNLLGILAGIAPTALTAGISSVPILRINSKDLGISKEDFTLANASQIDPIATNNKEHGARTDFIALDYAGGMDNAKIDLELTSESNFTTGWDVAMGAVFADHKPDNLFQMELLAQRCGPAKGGAETKAAGAVKLASWTAFATGITVPAKAGLLIGVLSHIIPNAPTDGESAVGLTKLESNDINNFSPQEWPFSVNFGPMLGTAVGTAALVEGFYYPSRFDLPKTNHTINVSQKFSVALTNEADGMAAIRYRA